MVTINKPFFWIFLACCIFLYTYSKFTMRVDNNDDIVAHAIYCNFVCIAAFVGLFFNLINGAIKNKSANRIFTIWCYLYEIGSLVTLAILLFSERK